MKIYTTYQLTTINLPDGSLYRVIPSRAESGYYLQLYSENGWKDSIAPGYPDGRKWRTVRHFASVREAIKSLEAK